MKGSTAKVSMVKDSTAEPQKIKVPIPLKLHSLKVLLAHSFEGVKFDLL